MRMVGRLTSGSNIGKLGPAGTRNRQREGSPSKQAQAAQHVPAHAALGSLTGKFFLKAGEGLLGHARRHHKACRNAEMQAACCCRRGDA